MQQLARRVETLVFLPNQRTQPRTTSEVHTSIRVHGGLRPVLPSPPTKNLCSLSLGPRSLPLSPFAVQTALPYTTPPLARALSCAASRFSCRASVLYAFHIVFRIVSPPQMT